MKAEGNIDRHGGFGLKKDVVIIGGGVVGCGVARLLSAYEVSVVLLERGADVAEGASKANSGIVHAGFDAKPSSLKAKLNVRGAEMYEDLCRDLSVPYGSPGALVLAFAEEDRSTIAELLRQGQENGVPGLEILEREAILALEPNANPEVVCALHVPTSGITSPYELTFALADHAAVNGVDFRLETEVVRVEKSAVGFLVQTEDENIEAKIVINCAGVESAKVHNFLSEEKLTIIPRKGEYYLFDHEYPLPFTKTMFQTPTKMGKGVLISPTVHGNILLGPTATDIADGLDVSTTAEALTEALTAAKKTWPTVSLRGVITTFAGVRAHETEGDFVVGGVAGAPGAYETVGIESPGLTAAPAIAELLCELIATENGLAKKAEWKPALKRKKAFSAMTLEERSHAVTENPEYGGVVCRCEEVTEAEIREAIRRPVGAKNIDGVKRRTRAGMGRCQGGFCSPRVLEILAEELNVSPLKVTKGGGKSVLLVDTIENAMKKGGAQ